MKKRKNIKNLCLAFAALILVAGLGIQSAMAYFTTYELAKGGVSLTLKFPDTEIEEKVIALEKIVRVKNEGQAPCYVRIKLLISGEYTGEITMGEETTGWTQNEDGYYYYDSILQPGQDNYTSEIYLGFDLPKENPEYTSFNAIVIQECTPVLYDEDGLAYADWNVKADISQIIVPENNQGNE